MNNRLLSLLFLSIFFVILAIDLINETSLSFKDEESVCENHIERAIVFNGSLISGVLCIPFSNIFWCPAFISPGFSHSKASLEIITFGFNPIMEPGYLEQPKGRIWFVWFKLTKVKLPFLIQVLKDNEIHGICCGIH